VKKLKEKSPQKLLSEYTKQLVETLNRWEKQHKNGCNDPFWPDGCNLNLLRNHMFYYKRKIRELCEQIKTDIPGEYFLPIPPYIDSNYFAKPNSKRAKRIKSVPGWECANLEEISKKSFNNRQMKLFD
jgi:hypothetical protein